MILTRTYSDIDTWVRLICAFRAHIKLSICGNIFSELKKLSLLFQLLKKNFSKMEINVCPKSIH